MLLNCFITDFWLNIILFFGRDVNHSVSLLLITVLTEGRGNKSSFKKFPALLILPMEERTFPLSDSPHLRPSSPV